ncbi:MAG: helicase-associated domain-containing protein [Phycisphaerae bacterium]
MKQFDGNWQDFLRRLEVWENLTLKTRRILSELKGGTDVDSAKFGVDLSRLLQSEFLCEAKNGKRTRLHNKACSFGRTVRAMMRNKIIDQPDPETLSQYICDLLTGVERHALAADTSHYYNSSEFLTRSCRSAAWLLQFIGIDGIKASRKWESERRPVAYYGKTDTWQPMIRTAKMLDAAQKMLGELMIAKEPVPFAKLAQRLNLRDPEMLSAVIRFGIRYLFLFPTMRREDMTPVLTVWPPIAERLNQKNAKRPKSVLVEKKFGCATLMEDMTTILVVVAGESPRIRQIDSRLFARAQKEIEAKLMPVPKWYSAIQGTIAGDRLDDALTNLRWLEFVVNAGTIGKDYRLEATPEGMAWLGTSAKERLKYILDKIKGNTPCLSDPGKVAPETKGADATASIDGALRIGIGMDDEYDDDFDDFYYDEDDPFGASRDPDRKLKLLARTPHWAMGIDLGEEIEPSAVEAFRMLAGRRFVPLARFLEYHAQQDNPLLRPRANGRPFQLRIDWTLQEPLPEEAEECWLELLDSFWLHRLLPLGCVEIGIGKKGDETCIALTDVGRYLLNKASRFEYGGQCDSEGHVVVQPNFDVVFMAPSPLAEAAVARFAERKGSGTGTLFKITKKSIVAAASTRMTAEATLESLRGISAKPIPDNVAREIQGWFDGCRRVAIQPAILIHCPDTATATKVLAIGGKALTSVSDTVLELADVSGKTTLVRKLKHAGVFVDQAIEPAVTRPPVRRGKRRRWGW